MVHLRPSLNYSSFVVAPPCPHLRTLRLLPISGCSRHEDRGGPSLCPAASASPPEKLLSPQGCDQGLRSLLESAPAPAPLLSSYLRSALPVRLRLAHHVSASKTQAPAQTILWSR